MALRMRSQISLSFLSLQCRKAFLSISSEGQSGSYLNENTRSGSQSGIGHTTPNQEAFHKYVEAAVASRVGKCPARTLSIKDCYVRGNTIGRCRLDCKPGCGCECPLSIRATSRSHHVTERLFQNRMLSFGRLMSSRSVHQSEFPDTSQTTKQPSSTGNDVSKSSFVEEMENDPFLQEVRSGTQSTKAETVSESIDIEEDEDEPLEKAEREYLEALGKGEVADIDLEQLENLLGHAPKGDATVGTLYLRLGLEYDANGESAEQILRCGQRALQIFQTRTEDVRVELAMALHLIAMGYVRQEKYEASISALHEALKLFESKGGEQSRSAKCAVRFLLGEALSSWGKADEALGHLRTAVSEQEVLLGENHLQLGKSYRKMAEVLANVMKHDEALLFARRALEIHIEAHGEGSMDEAIDRRLLAVIHVGLEDHEKALGEHKIVRKILSTSEHASQLVFVDISTADTEITLGKYDEAISSLETALSKAEKGSAMHALALVNLAKVYERKKQPDVVDKYAKDVVEILENRVLTNSDPLAVAEGYTELAALYEKINQTDSAIEMLKKAHAIYAPIPHQRNAVAGTQAQIGMLLFFTGKVEEAVPFLENAVENLEGSVGEQNFALAMVLNHLGVAKVELEKLEAATGHFERAKRIFDEVLGSDHDDTIAVARNLVNTYSLLDRLDDAIKYQREVVSELELKGDETKEMLEDAMQHLQMLEQHLQDGKLGDALFDRHRCHGSSWVRRGSQKKLLNFVNMIINLDCNASMLRLVIMSMRFKMFQGDAPCDKDRYQGHLCIRIQGSLQTLSKLSSV